MGHHHPLISPAYTRIIYLLVTADREIIHKKKRIPSKSPEGLALSCNYVMPRIHEMVKTFNAKAGREIIGRNAGGGAGKRTQFYIDWNKVMELTLDIAYEEENVAFTVQQSKKLQKAIKKGMEIREGSSLYGEYIKNHFENILLRHIDPDNSSMNIEYDKTLTVREIIHEFLYLIGILVYNKKFLYATDEKEENSPQEALWVIGSFYLSSKVLNPKCKTRGKIDPWLKV